MIASRSPAKPPVRSSPTPGNGPSLADSDTGPDSIGQRQTENNFDSTDPQFDARQIRIDVDQHDPADRKPSDRSDAPSASAPIQTNVLAKRLTSFIDQECVDLSDIRAKDADKSVFVVRPFGSASAAFTEQIAQGVTGSVGQRPPKHHVRESIIDKRLMQKLLKGIPSPASGWIELRYHARRFSGNVDPISGDFSGAAKAAHLVK